MDEDLKTYLEGMETRILGTFEKSIQVATSDLETRIVGTFEKSIRVATSDLETRIMSRMDGRLDAVEQRLQEYIRAADIDLETKIVGEFWKWGRTSDARTKQAITDVGILGERVLNIEDRVSALERNRT